MSETMTCDCNLYDYRVVRRYVNRWGKPNKYCEIICMECGWTFASNAKWVDDCKDASAADLATWNAGGYGFPNIGELRP